MKCNKKMYEISEKMKKLTDEAEVLNNNGEIDKANAKLDEYDTLKKEFDTEKRLYEASKPFEVEEKETTPGTTAEGAVTAEKAFADAARHKFMVEGTDADGGYTVPEDIQTKISHYKTEEFTFEDYINVETVSTNKGARTFLSKAADFALEAVDENGVIPEIDTPTFERATYSIKNFGGYLPVSKDLLADTDANITGELSGWFAKARRGTTNAQVLELVGDKTAVELDGVDGIKDAIIKTLGGAYAGAVKIFTNDDGVAYLAKLKDQNGRYLLNPNPSDPAQMQLGVGARVIPVVQVPNAVLATTDDQIPVIIGDLMSAFTKFDRQQSVISTSDVASTAKYNAFTQNLVLYKIFMRMDYVTVDEDAFVNGYISAATAAAADDDNDDTP